MELVENFFAGVFLCNCVPHVVAGLQGRLFPTPFGRPPGEGNSSSLVNFLWGSFNLLVASSLLNHSPIAFGANGATATFAAGFVVVGVVLSVHFGKVYLRNSNANRDS